MKKEKSFLYMAH